MLLGSSLLLLSIASAGLARTIIVNPNSQYFRVAARPQYFFESAVVPSFFDYSPTTFTVVRRRIANPIQTVGLIAPPAVPTVFSSAQRQLPQLPMSAPPAQRSNFPTLNFPTLISSSLTPPPSTRAREEQDDQFASAEIDSQRGGNQRKEENGRPTPVGDNAIVARPAPPPPSAWKLAEQKQTRDAQPSSQDEFISAEIGLHDRT